MPVGSICFKICHLIFFSHSIATKIVMGRLHYYLSAIVLSCRCRCYLMLAILNSLIFSFIVKSSYQLIWIMFHHSFRSQKKYSRTSTLLWSTRKLTWQRRHCHGNMKDFLCTHSVFQLVHYLIWRTHKS